MLVYGDSCLGVPAAKLARGLKLRLLACHKPDLSELRVWLVTAGQIEQAALDSKIVWNSKARQLTEVFAAQFVACSLNVVDAGWDAERRAGAARLLGEIERDAACLPESCPIKIPEGFAWYALYPDAYVRTAVEWAHCHSPQRRVLVVGLRSIGTTLAAVVTACLRRHGFAVISTTVRPEGHPFARQVEFEEDFVSPDAAIIVDEGPGLSGSSMAAAAEALHRSGLPDQAISFFPGHVNGPGDRASDGVRDWWRRVETRVTELPDVCFGRQTFQEMLLGGCKQSSIADLIALSSDVWTELTGLDRGAIASIAPALETPKYLARGSNSATLWKFAGFTASQTFADGKLLTRSEVRQLRLDELSDAGIAETAVACTHGWVGTGWITGRHLTAKEGDRAALGAVLSYMRKVAKPPLEFGAAAAARVRLSEMLIQNSKELIGETAACLAKRAGDYILRETRLDELSSYGDGRLAPHKWVRTRTNALVKTDVGGHDDDHTIVGPQTILWDLAGLSVEWDLAPDRSENLLRAFDLSPDLRIALACYTAAYVAFRSGMAAFFAPEDCRERAIAFYRCRLEKELNVFLESSSGARSL